MESHARHYGIDLLKITAMFMVSLMHALVGGGIMSGVEWFSTEYETLQLLETFAYCGVNCFALASGFILVNLTYRFQRLLSLWVQVVFYCVLFTVGFFLLRPEAVAARAWLFALFPVTFGQYWYFSAYFGMFCMIPLLNHILHTMRQKALLYTIGVFVLFNSIIASLGYTPVFESEYGYSMLWICGLYLIGGYLSMYPVRWKARTMLLTYCLATLVSWGFRLLVKYVFPALTAYVSPYILINYNAPTILIASVCLLVVFSQLNIRSPRFIRVIRFFAPLTFGIYLVQTHPLIWDYVLKGRLSFLCSLPPLPLAGAVLLAAICLFLLCAGVDFLRLCLFRALRVPERCEKLVQRVKLRLTRPGAWTGSFLS